MPSEEPPSLRSGNPSTGPTSIGDAIGKNLKIVPPTKFPWGVMNNPFSDFNKAQTKRLDAIVHGPAYKIAEQNSRIVSTVASSAIAATKNLIPAESARRLAERSVPKMSANLVTLNAFTGKSLGLNVAAANAKQDRLNAIFNGPTRRLTEGNVARIAALTPSISSQVKTTAAIDALRLATMPKVPEVLKPKSIVDLDSLTRIGKIAMPDLPERYKPLSALADLGLDEDSDTESVMSVFVESSRQESERTRAMLKDIRLKPPPLDATRQEVVNALSEQSLVVAEQAAATREQNTTLIEINHALHAQLEEERSARITDQKVVDVAQAAADADRKIERRRHRIGLAVAVALATAPTGIPWLISVWPW